MQKIHLSFVPHLNGCIQKTMKTYQMVHCHWWVIRSRAHRVPINTVEASVTFNKRAEEEVFILMVSNCSKETIETAMATSAIFLLLHFIVHIFIHQTIRLLSFINCVRIIH